MSSKRYTEEFKIEAVKQVTQRGYSVADVVNRSGTRSLTVVSLAEALWTNRVCAGECKG